MEGGWDVPYGEVRADRSRRSECLELNTAVSSARRVEKLSESASLVRVHGRVT